MKPSSYIPDRLDSPHKIIHINLQSIGNVLSRLDNYVNNHKCHFLAVTEHWKSTQELRVHGISNFDLISSFCRRRGQHGGSALYCRRDVFVSATEFGEFARLSVSYSFECSAMKVNIECDEYVLICSIYRSQHPSRTDVKTFF